MKQSASFRMPFFQQTWSWPWRVDSFGAFLLDGVVGDAGGSAVVGLEGRWWLGMAEFFEGDANGTGFFAIVEEGSELGFGSAGDDFAHYLAERVNGTVRRWRQRIGVGGSGRNCRFAAEAMVAGGSGAWCHRFARSEFPRSKLCDTGATPTLARRASHRWRGETRLCIGQVSRGRGVGFQGEQEALC